MEQRVYSREDKRGVMKVWYILMTFPSPSETFVANDLRALVRLGVDVSVHALLGARADAEQLLHARGLGDLKVTHGTTANILRGCLAALTNPVRAARLIAWVVRQSGGRVLHMGKGLVLVPRILGLFEHLEREEPDVVHLYWGHYPSIFGWLVLDSAPRVVVSLSLSAYDLLNGYPGSATVARRAHLVSTWAATNLPAIAERGLSPDAVHVCWQGVDVERFRANQLQKTPHRVVTVGRLVAEKGMDDVIRAFGRIAAIHADAHLVVLGEGPDRRRLEKLAATLGLRDAISFRGHIPHDEVFEELTRAELFLFLSRSPSDRLPNVVKEAMACRCLVVTTATSGIEELLQHGTHGWIVPLGAWEEAAERAIEAFADLDTTRVMVAEAQRHVVETFDLTRLMAGMVGKWQERRASLALDTILS